MIDTSAHKGRKHLKGGLVYDSGKKKRERDSRQVRKQRFRVEEQSRDKRRAGALYKVKIRKEISRLKKLGKFDDEALRDIKKRI